jgi:hypothetical protein
VIDQKPGEPALSGEEADVPKGMSHLDPGISLTQIDQPFPNSVTLLLVPNLFRLEAVNSRTL